MRRVTWHTSGTAAAVFPELADRRRPLGPAASGMADPGSTGLEQAERQAQALMASARQKASALLEEARREGALQGRAEGLAEARQGLQELTRSLAAACLRLRALDADCRARAEELVVTLALATAERVLRRTVTQDPAAIVEPVKTALAALPAPEDVVVRVHPACAALLQAHWDELRESGPTPAGLRVVADPSVAAGGCLVETPHSVVDATLAAQLEEARRRLLEAPC